MKTNKIWIEAASKALVQSGIVNDQGVYPKAFTGYISSFAATVVQSGLFPAIVTYEYKSSRAEAQRTLIPLAIMQILHNQKIIPENWKDCLLSDYYASLLNDPKAKESFEQAVEQAVVAMKLALRMYKKGNVISETESGNIGEDQISETNRNKPIDIDINIYDNDRNKTLQNRSANMGWLFYRNYYRDYEKNYRIAVQYHYKVRENKLSEKPRVRNKQELILQYVRNPYLLNTQLASMLPGNERVKQALGNEFRSLKLVTQYPGLLIGMGLNHGTPIKNDLKCGFQFDYTTGLPVIPGSSVKGVLRSYFPRLDAKDDNVDYNKLRCTYIRSVLEMQDPELGKLSDKDIINLTQQIFAPKCGLGDVFMDAIITGGPSGRFMADDYITPHYKNLYKDPVPIQFIKILPGVEFTFFFRLSPFSIGNVDIDKLSLFKRILQDVGIGAKTNVGYGRLG